MKIPMEAGDISELGAAVERVVTAAHNLEYRTILYSQACEYGGANMVALALSELRRARIELLDNARALAELGPDDRADADRRWRGR
jgi:hypothetical protein